jgi:hypothetical protein
MSDGSNSYRMKKKKEEVTLTKKIVKEGKAEAKLAVGKAVWLDSDFGIKRQRTDESAEEEDKIKEDISCLHIR